MLILGILGFGMLVGAIAQFLVGRHGRGIDWGMAIGAGLLGSLVGGLLASLLAGDGLALRPSGLIGSVIGAVIVTIIWESMAKRRQPAPAPAERAKHGHTHKR